MKEIIKVRRDHEIVSLVSGVTYSSISDWYDAVYTDLKMDLLIPRHREGHAAMPAILWLCGGAFSTVSRNAWIPELMYFAQAGYVVASAEYRTSNQKEFPAGLIDVKTAVRFLKARAGDFCIDPDRIIVMGESAGATYACLAGVTAGEERYEGREYRDFNSSVAAVVDFYGPVDFSVPAICRDGVPHPWTVRAFLGKDTEEQNAPLASAVNYVNENTPPFMILHGAEDRTVPITQSEALYQKLCEHQVPVEYLVLEGAPHGDPLFFQNEVKERVLDFLDRAVRSRRK